MPNRRAIAIRTTGSRSVRTWGSLLAVGAVACGALVVPSAGQVLAGSGDSAVSSSRFLGGSLLLDSVDLDTIAVLDGTNSSNSGTPAPDTDTATLDLTALQTANVTVPGGVSLGVFPNVLQIGAVNHYSQASDDGISRAASGAVSNAGAIDTTGSGSFPSNAQISLDPLLTGPAFAGRINQLDLSAGAITGVAALDARQGSPATTCIDLSAPSHCLDYNVADLTVALSSPAIAELAGLISAVALSVDSELDVLAGANGTLAAALSLLTGVDLGVDTGVVITIDSEVTTALDVFLDTALSDGIVSIDLRTGAILADLDLLLQDVTGTGINSLAPNTEVLSATLLTALADRVDALLATVPTAVEAAVDAAVLSSTVNIDVDVCLAVCVTIDVVGTISEVLAGIAFASITITTNPGGVPVLGFSAAALLVSLHAPINAALATLDAVVIPGAVASLVTAVTERSVLVRPAITALPSIVSLRANVQEAGSTAGSYREVALRLTLGDLIGPGGVGTVDLGAAEVGRNTVVPAGSSMTPDRGTADGGTSVTIIGTDFVAGETTVNVDGISVTPSVVSSASLTFDTPPHAAGAVPVTVTTPGGTTAPLTFTYYPVPTESSMTPVRGPVAGGMTVTITGTGFVLGETSVVIDATSVPAAVASPTSLTFVTPAHAAGTVPVAVTTPGGSSTANLTYTYDPVPVESSMTPVRGPVAGGMTVTITGTGFVPGETSVTVDATSVVPMVASSTELSFVTPAHALGPVDVTVTTPGGTSAPLTYTYDPLPIATSLSVDRGPLVGGTSVTVTGSGFVPGETSVSVGSTVVTTVVSDPTTLTFVTPPNAAGSVDVTVTTPGGTSDPLTYTYDPVPTGTSLVPDRGPIAGGTTVTVTGTGFVDGNTSVSVGSTVVTTVVSDPTTLTFVTPPNGPGSVDVTVTTPGGTSVPLTFSFDPIPTESSLAPGRGPIVGGMTVTVTGTGFVPGETSVVVDAITVPASVGSATSLTFVTPAHAAGTVPVSITTPGGSSGATLTYLYDPVPTESSLTPVRGPIAGGTSVTVAGTGFIPGETSVTVDATTLAPTVMSSTSLTFVTPAHAAGPVDVTVTTPGGSSAPLTYTYDPIPTESSLSPDHGPISGGTVVTINGTGYVSGGTTVTIDAASVTATVASPTSLTFTTPAHAIGPVDVTVTTPGGTSAPLTYTYDLAPNTASLSPERGPLSGGTTVTVSGSGFESGQTSVTFDGDVIPASQVAVTGTTSLEFVTPERLAGPVEVTVTTPGGTSSPALTYTYDPVPTETSITPDRGPDSGGTTVTITGTGFVADETKVRIDSIERTPTVSSSTSLTFVTPAHVAGPVDVTVTTPGGTSAPLTYSYDAVPTESSMTPVRGPVEGGTKVSITGTGFVPGRTTVDIDTTTIGPADVAVVSATSLTFTTPAHSADSVDVTVTTPGGTSNPLAYTYEVAPTIDEMTPPRGPLGGGMTVTMFGTGFIPGLTSVTVDGSPMAVSVSSSTRLTFVNPAHAAGPADVAVATAGGISAPSIWMYDPQPTAAPLLPARGIAAGGAVVTVDGTGFVDGFTSVTVDGVDVAADVGSSTLVSFVTPAHAAGVVDVVVSTTGGVAEAQAFTYLPVPEMKGLDVTSGPAAGGTSVTIEGEGFLVDESTVMIGSAMIRPSSVKVAEAGTSLTFVTPAHPAGAALVVVQTPGGVASPPLDFNFAAPAPLVPGGGRLPETGLDTGGLLVPAGLLLIFGGLFLALSNGRRRELTDTEG